MQSSLYATSLASPQKKMPLPLEKGLPLPLQDEAPTPLMTWTPEMSVSVKVLDDDHKKLIEMINTLHEGISSGKPRPALEAVIEGLLRYTKFHFAREEKILAQAGFPNSAAHASEHNLMARRVMNLQARFECGQSMEMSLEAMKFVKNWLTEHILGSDMAYVPFLNAKGIV